MRKKRLEACIFRAFRHFGLWNAESVDITEKLKNGKFERPLKDTDLLLSWQGGMARRPFRGAPATLFVVFLNNAWQCINVML